MEISNLNIEKSRELLLSGKVTARELTEKYLENTFENEEKINAFITINREKALEDADLLDEKIKNEEKVGKFAGSVIALKDNIVTKDFRTTAGSKILQDFISPYDATVVEKLLNEDAIIIGKTNMDEFAMGSSGLTSYFEATKNPLNEELTAGGSSGGSAAAVKSGDVLFALGSDTGGSVRQPASYCGLVGMKPTYGSVSRSGLIAMANSLDQIGVITNKVEDTLDVMSVLIDEDEKDSSTIGNKKILDKFEKRENLKIALPNEFFEMDLEEGIKESVLDAVEDLKSLGASVEYVDMPSLKYGLTAYYLINTAEISSNLSRYDGIRYGVRSKKYSSMDELYSNTRKEGLGFEAKRRIISGSHILKLENRSDYYIKALKIKTMIIEDFNNIFKDFDIIVTPTTPDYPFKLNEKRDILDRYDSNIFTIPSNLAGNCAITIPAKKVKDYYAGIQIIGDRFADKLIIDVAKMLQDKMRGEL